MPDDWCNDWWEMAILALGYVALVVAVILDRAEHSDRRPLWERVWDRISAWWWRYDCQCHFMIGHCPIKTHNAGGTDV